LIPALIGQGCSVRALARSPAAAAKVRSLGACVVEGDLFDVDALHRGVADADLVFHAAARVRQWCADDSVHRVNVTGTENVVAACTTQPEVRLVHVSTEAVLAGSGRALVRADETWPLPVHPSGVYPRTKALAEQRVLSAAHRGLDAVIVRPRFVWGPGDTSVLPKLVDAVKGGRFTWISGGRYPMSTCHVDNLVEGLLLAAEHGVRGSAYFITDGPPVEARWFLSELLATQGLRVPRRSIPRPVAKALAAVCELMWERLPLSGDPPVTRTAVELVGSEVTLDDRKAREKLGYQGIVSHKQGLAAMRNAP